MVSRRALLAAAPATALAAVSGFAQPVLALDQPALAQRVHDLASELSGLLDQLDGGAWQLRVSPLFRGEACFSVEPVDVAPRLQLEKGLSIAKAALQRLAPGDWRVEYAAGLVRIVDRAAAGGAGQVDEQRLATAIERHRAAWQAFEASCAAADACSPDFDPVNGKRVNDRLDRQEERARRAVLACRAVTPAAQRLKAGHLKWCLDVGALDLVSDLPGLLRAMESA